ncbi:MAG: PhnD/SsuA/transferrin family substrate-binding protein [Myxococcales bacterium]|nr:PhnD/SsuA/transferrin family substrate-binding protein [Polyangiaceae bacterium]MDW8250771.1 PhnD/SsuA/transferrin family substrate-binding protein [Myxococcales bacterium]
MLRVGLVSAAEEKARRVLEVGLEGALQESCRARLWTSYAALVDALMDGEEEVAWLPPVAYLRARKRGPVTLLATVERGGKGSYGCVLLGRAGVVNRIEAAEGKRAVWVDPWSAAGYIVPRALIRAAGYNPDAFFSAQSFAGSYASLLSMLTYEQAEVGACYCRLDEQGQPEDGPWFGREDFSLLAHSSPIPGDTLCAGPALSHERLAHLKTVLTGKLPPPALLVVLQATALRPPDQGAYDDFEAKYLDPAGRR